MGIAHSLHFKPGYHDPLPGEMRISVEDLTSPWWVWRNLRPLVNRYRQVIIHTHCWPAHTAVWVLKWFARARITWVMTDHFVFPAHAGNTQRWKGMIRRVLRRGGYYPDYFIAVSDFSRRELEKLFGSRRVTTIYNGIRLPDCPVPVPLRRMPVRGVFVGRLIPEKGARVAVEAVRLAREQGVEWSLDVVGGGEELDFLTDYIKQHDLADRVWLRGATRTPDIYYQQADFAVIPSLCNESFGLVSVEAQAHYLPCIYSNRGGLPETQVDGKTGIMLESVTAENVLAAVRRLQSDPAAFERMRLRARQNAERFSMEKMVREMLGLYEQLFS